MSDYLPLFDSSYTPARRVFNAAGAPVFARVRSGTVDIPFAITGTVVPDPDAIPYPPPAGSTTFSPTISLTRTAYESFTTASSVVYSDYVVIGTTNEGFFLTEWAIRCYVYNVTCAYISSSAGFRITARAGVQRSSRRVSSGLPFEVWDEASATFTYNHDATGKLLPDNGYTVVTASSTTGYCTVSVGASLSAGFTES